MIFTLWYKPISELVFILLLLQYSVTDFVVLGLWSQLLKPLNLIVLFFKMRFNDNMLLLFGVFLLIALVCWRIDEAFNILLAQLTNRKFQASSSVFFPGILWVIPKFHFVFSPASSLWNTRLLSMISAQSMCTDMLVKSLVDWDSTNCSWMKMVRDTLYLIMQMLHFRKLRQAYTVFSVFSFYCSPNSYY